MRGRSSRVKVVACDATFTYLTRNAVTVTAQNTGGTGDWDKYALPRDALTAYP